MWPSSAMPGQSLAPRLPSGPAALGSMTKGVRRKQKTGSAPSGPPPHLLQNRYSTHSPEGPAPSRPAVTEVKASQRRVPTLSQDCRLRSDRDPCASSGGHCTRSWVNLAVGGAAVMPFLSVGETRGCTSSSIDRIVDMRADKHIISFKSSLVGSLPKRRRPPCSAVISWPRRQVMRLAPLGGGAIGANGSGASLHDAIEVFHSSEMHYRD